MSEFGHDLNAIFPDKKSLIHNLNSDNQYFKSLTGLYHHLIQEIGRIEAGLDPASDDRLEGLKKMRLAILDQVATMLAKEEGVHG